MTDSVTQPSPVTTTEKLVLLALLLAYGLLAFLYATQTPDWQVPDEPAHYNYTRQVAEDASKVTFQQVAALKDLGFTDGEVFDIAATAAGRAFFTKLLDALGVEADSPFLAMEATFRDPLTVGRPIDTRPPVQLASPLPG
jgi:hypothetical protein